MSSWKAVPVDMSIGSPGGGGGGVCVRGGKKRERMYIWHGTVWMWGLAFLTCLRWYLLYREGLFASGRLTGF